ncbi:MAG: ABC transporter permease [Deltaproteobacteria bacterium]|nr:ABC transporter permease [Deltaproteobacteria bacterium]
MLSSPHRISIARKMLLHKKARLAMSLSAMAFTVVIMLMEMGFFNGINDSQARLATYFNADLIMMDIRSIHLNKYATMDRSRMMQAMGFEEVVEAVPIYKALVGMKNPQTGLTKVIFVMAFPPGSTPLGFPNSEEIGEALKRQGTVVFDAKSRRIFGRIEPGQDIEISGRKYRVAGLVELGPNFSIDGTILMSDATWLWGRWARESKQIAYGLLRTRPGSDVHALKQRILDRLPKDIIVLTPEELRRREVIHTIKAVPLGAIFGVGMIIGFVIGVIICYQILYNEITDHMPQYATLRAMGFSDRFLRKTVVQEALWLSALGFIPGLAFGYLLYAVIEYYTGILMFLTIGRIALIFCFTIVMCAIGGLIAVKRVTSADPASLY